MQYECTFQADDIRCRQKCKCCKFHQLRQVSNCKQCAYLTFIAVTDGVEVNVILLISEEQQTEPRVKGVDRHEEEDANDVPLLIRSVVVAQVHVDLKHRQDNTIQIFSYLLSSLLILCHLLFFINMHAAYIDAVLLIKQSWQ